MKIVSWLNRTLHGHLCRTWSGYWIVANRRALAGLPADLQEIARAQFDGAEMQQRADLAVLDQSLRADLAARGMNFTSLDAQPFKTALARRLLRAMAEDLWHEAWACLERYTGSLT